MFSKPKLLVYGTHPVESKHTSDSKVSSLLVTLSTKWTIALPDGLIYPLVLFLLKRNSIPYFLRVFNNSLDCISSDFGSILSECDITVTLEPTLEYTEAISNPITPAPITVNLSGTLDKLRAPVEETKILSSIVNPLT